MKTEEFIKQVKNGSVSVEEHTLKIIEEAQKLNDEYNYFNNISLSLALERAREIDQDIKAGKAKGSLLGIPVSVKDCIVVKGVESTAGSRILKGYIPTFQSTAVRKCVEEGAVIIGKTSQDEFGFGSFSMNVGVGFKPPKNPIDNDRVCGGSSGGAAGFSQKTKFNHIAMAESTGGSIACPAAFCGVVGLTPTYGLVSRYGLMDYANSLDKIGSIGKSVYDCAAMLNVISGHDNKDSTSSHEKEDYMKYLNEDISRLRIGVIRETFAEGTNIYIGDKVRTQIEKFNVEAEEVSLPFAQKYSLPVYYMLAMSEASTNLAKYCGLRYGASDELKGNYNEYFSDIRSANFGAEAKRRIMLGTFMRMAGYRDAYYLKAAKIRTKIISEYKKAFKNYDLLISPTMPVIAPKFDEVQKLTPLQNYMMDIMTVGPNLAGLPHISVPVGMHNGMPAGMMMISNHFNEGKLIQLAKEVKWNS